MCGEVEVKLHATLPKHQTEVNSVSRSGSSSSGPRWMEAGGGLDTVAQEKGIEQRTVSPQQMTLLNYSGLSARQPTTETIYMEVYCHLMVKIRKFRKLLRNATKNLTRKPVSEMKTQASIILRSWNSSPSFQPHFCLKRIGNKPTNQQSIS